MVDGYTLETEQRSAKKNEKKKKIDTINAKLQFKGKIYGIFSDVRGGSENGIE